MSPTLNAAPRRPLGVVALALATAVAGVATMLRAIWEPFRSLFDGSVLGSPWVESAGIVSPPDGVIGALLGAAFVVAGVGLYVLRPWAWWLAVVVGAAGLVLSLGSILWMVVFGALLVYLVIVHEFFSSLRISGRVPTH